MKYAIIEYLKSKKDKLSKKDYKKAMKGLKRIAQTEEACFKDSACQSLSTSFYWEDTIEGWSFWNRIEEEVTK